MEASPLFLRCDGEMSVLWVAGYQLRFSELCITEAHKTLKNEIHLHNI